MQPGADLADLAAASGIDNIRLLNAIRVVARADFVPPDRMHLAAHDEPVSIGHDQVTTQPTLIAAMIDALDPGDDDVVLEVGTGFGYQTALLAHLARFVWSVERLPRLAAAARSNLAAAGIVNADVVTGDGTPGTARTRPVQRHRRRCRLPSGALAAHRATGAQRPPRTAHRARRRRRGGPVRKARRHAAPRSPRHPRRLRPTRRRPRIPHHERSRTLVTTTGPPLTYPPAAPHHERGHADMSRPPCPRGRGSVA